MPPCDLCRNMLLELEYGLLDPAETAAVEAHLADCPTCRAARAEATQLHELLGRAAKSAFPGVAFVAPTAVETAVVQTPAVPVDRRPSVTQVWVRWVVAAGLLLAVTGLCGPAARDTIGFYAHKSDVSRELAAVKQADAERTERRERLALATTQAEKRLADAEAKFATVTTNWAAAEEQVATKVAERPFTLDVRGPTTAIPGAPNEYELAIADKAGQPLAAEITAEVKDAAGTVYYTSTQKAANATPSSTIRLPAEIWADAPPTADLSLHVTAIDTTSGARSAVSEDVRLRDAVYTTFLATDKTMYRPGEDLYFRSTTLDRTTFRPPTSELNLRYLVTAPSGQPVPGMDLIGLAKPANPDGTPVLGPDGRPVRGVGTGAFPLPDGLAGGEYTLSAYDLPANQARPVPGAKPIAGRKFTVNNYTPDRLLKKLEFDGKTYGPGDTVQAKFDVADQGQPLAGAKLTISAAADGKELELGSGPAATGPDGTAAIRFTLPNVEAINDARLSVTVATAGNVETIVRPVPLATRKLTVEFFPEGGDLIAGVSNTVYFRATTNTGKPADITGTLTDGRRDLADVRTLTDADKPGVNQGLGSFAFTPEPGVRYAVRLATPIGVVPPVLPPTNPTALVAGTAAVERGYELPPAKADGVVLHVLDTVSESGKPIRVRLTSAGEKRAVVVGAYIRNQPVAHSKATLDADKPTELALDCGSATIGGVTRITVFEEPAEDDGRADLTPVAERLVFRNPGEVLKLNVAAKKVNGTAPKAFVPGESVTLDVAATTESGSPTSAVLWAAVVNQSVLTMADDKTERLMPTHFLLGGEIRQPEELEHADFLLTDHPKAEATLDLLLGTQGWRRFAEQAPGRFRDRAPAEDADRLLVVMGADQPVPRGWRTDVRRVFDTYWPEYEAAAHDLDLARNDDRSEVREADEQYTSAAAAYQARLQSFGGTAADLEPYYASIVDRRYWMPATLGLMAVGVVILLVARGTFPAGSGERRPLAFGAVGLAAVAGFLLLSLALTGFGNRDWQRVAAVAPKPADEYEWAGMDVAATAPMAAEDGFEPMDEMAKDGGKFDDMNADGARFGKIGGDIGAANPAAEGLPNDAEGGFPRPGAARLGFDPQFEPAEMRKFKGGPVVAPPEPAAPMAAMAPQRGANKVEEKLVEGPAFAGEALRRQRLDGRALNVPRDAAKKEMFRGGFAQPMFDMKEANGGRRADRDFEYTERVPAGLAKALRSMQEMQTAGGKRQQAADYLMARIADSMPQAAPLVVREYAHARPTAETEIHDPTRTDFTETLLWQPVVVTPTDGKVSLSFALADAVAPYRVIVAGHTLDGRIGATSELIEVRKPFAVDPKLPPEISSTDTIDVPVLLTNATDDPRTATLTVTPDGLTVADGPAERSVELTANGGGRAIVRLTPTKADGELAVTVAGTAGPGVTDSIRRTLTVVPDGFPFAGSHADTLEESARATVTMPSGRIAGTSKVTVTVYPNTLSELQAGLDGLLQSPYGCFEQASTTNYPNVLISRYLEETNQAKPDVSRKAKAFMASGYAMLVGYECPKTGRDSPVGFEWFGAKDQQHEALSAYGLLQFTDMSHVYPVDPAMLQRTKSFLLASRDGTGGFARNKRALDSFGGAPDDVTNAYIVWAITEAEKGAADPSDLTKEIDALFAQATAKDGPAAKDPYFLALTANVLLNRGRQTDGVKLLEAIAKMQAKDGSIPGARTSITRSSGRTLQIETTAIAVLGFLKANRNDLFVAPTQSAMRWIGQQRGGSGGFGSSQSTILALKALIEHARASKRPAESGELEILVAGKAVGTRPFSTTDTGPIVFDVPDADGLFADNPVEVEVRTTAKQAYPMSVGWTCRTRTPNSSPACKVKLTTGLDRAECAEGAALRLDLKVENLADESHGMVVAIVGLPAGVKLPDDRKQLKALTEIPEDGTAPALGYYETKGRELVLYWRGMKPKQVTSFALDLIADVPGTYTAPASRAYLYYDDDHKHWVAPTAVTVRADGK